MMPEKGLYTGLAIFGAIGTGKTTSCMRPFARQLLEWQCHDPARRVAALVLEVKGDFCYDVQDMLRQYDRFDDYMEISLEASGWRWNPLNAPWLDTYSLAYTIAALVKSALRQEQGALLAAGLYERFALDHGGVPRQDRPSLVHARRRLPVAARQAAPRDHDR